MKAWYFGIMCKSNQHQFYCIQKYSLSASTQVYSSTVMFLHNACIQVRWHNNLRKIILALIKTISLLPNVWIILVLLILEFFHGY